MDNDDGNKYVVTSKVNHNEEIYYYLTDIDDYNIKFCKEKVSDTDLIVVEITDKILISKLITLFLHV